ncbi:MAG: TlpA family protein disulfide reductase [Magnetococcales bacterium]|nr:TlpA family protein disulfide reductase [Magnetococcales bacterium]
MTGVESNSVETRGVAARRSGWKIAAAAALGLILTAAPAAADKAEKHRQALDLALSSAQGGSLKLADYKGKVVLVNFWATWCPPCKREIPALTRAQERFKGQGLVVLGMNFMEKADKEKLVGFIKEHGINYPIAFTNPTDSARLAEGLGGVFGLPASFLLNREGVVVHVHTGELDDGKLNKLLEPLLGSVAPQTA